MEDNQVKVLIETEARSKSNTHRIDTLENDMKELTSLTTSVREMVVEQKHLTEELKELKGDVKSQNQKLDALEKVPGTRWNKVIDVIIGALAGGFLFYLFKGLI